ncbi:DUF4440 domain-containing protein [Parafrankia sp. BMG5.11]|uniref:DUF4440 domain-containing protein n=1 Tax=Parafrankia sp. BMG5.11 TaxID=222540 RepID=UPI00103C1D7B|nr:DUF4440 domain-containing protein [Parafrankia sp. BMG5.11]TCJ37457.1 DUF4440 domain-containing protein [Parafrankia sp. BMG5.11]
MDQFAAKIETLEHHWMRAWILGDRTAMKSLASREFIFLLGSTKPAILDRASWLEAATTRFRCTSYRFGEVYVRRHGGLSLFAAQLTMEGIIGDDEWSGAGWVTDLWARSKIRRKWQLVERVLSRPDEDRRFPPAIRSMQLWR